ncbi:HK97 family phage prohead protease [Streptomyces fungicidicus]|uniref:HK97 family phage prohead protease n=1 Tax=Streptomyces fungicidicus TaxID=68203 RepID=UPI0033E09B61
MKTILKKWKSLWDDKPRHITLKGYGVQWNILSFDHTRIGRNGRVKVREVTAKGAFQESIKNNHQLCLIDHNYDEDIGFTYTNTLRIKEDERGLYFEVDLPDNHLTNELLLDLYCSNGVLHASITFQAQEEYAIVERNQLIRVITRARLKEISILRANSYPQNSHTRVVPLYSDAYNSSRQRIHNLRHVVNWDKRLGIKKLAR